MVETNFVLICIRFAVASCSFSFVTMRGSEKNRVDLDVSKPVYFVRPQERLLDSNWEWGLYSVEWDPGVEISLVKCEGGNTEGGNNGCCTGS